MASDQIDVLLMVVTTLEELKIPYCIGGSFASSIHSISRATMDADLLAEINADQARALAAKLQDEFYADEQAIVKAVQAKRSFNLVHLDSMFKVDIFVAKGSGFEAMQLQRRQIKSLKPDSHQTAYVTTAEDIILAKLDWYRRGNEVSDRQWSDVLNVIKVQGSKLDFEYMKHWARELGVAELLAEALEDSPDKN